MKITNEVLNDYFTGIMYEARFDNPMPEQFNDPMFEKIYKAYFNFKNSVLSEMAVDNVLAENGHEPIYNHIPLDYKLSPDTYAELYNTFSKTPFSLIIKPTYPIEIDFVVGAFSVKIYYVDTLVDSLNNKISNNDILNQLNEFNKIKELLNKVPEVIKLKNDNDYTISVIEWCDGFDDLKEHWENNFYKLGDELGIEVLDLFKLTKHIRDIRQTNLSLDEFKALLKQKYVPVVECCESFLDGDINRTTLLDEVNKLNVCAEYDPDINLPYFEIKKLIYKKEYIDTIYDTSEPFYKDIVENHFGYNGICIESYFGICEMINNADVVEKATILHLVKSEYFGLVQLLVSDSSEDERQEYLKEHYPEVAEQLHGFS